MIIRKTFALLALSLPLTLTACSSASLPPIAPPVPQVIVKVPIHVQLPAGAADPCSHPVKPGGGVGTDVALFNVAAAWKVTALCNENKLKAIGKADAVAQ